MKRLLFFVYLLGPLACAFAQYVPNPTVGGLVVHCTDANGVLVLSGRGAISDSAMSTIQNGAPVIIFGPSFSSQPALLQLFTYAHECGHHSSGDVVAAVIYRHDDWGREMTADRIGIRLMRDQLHITLAQAQWLASYFVRNPPIPPYYLPGPERAAWIVDCYKTNDESCGHSPADYSKNDRSTDVAGSFCSVLNKAISSADHRFRDIKGTKCVQGDCDSALVLPGADHCTIIGHGFFCRMHAETDADDLRNQIKVCLTPPKWTQDDDGDFSSSGSDNETDVRVSENHSHTNITISRE